VAGSAAHYCDPFSVKDITRALYEVWSDAELRAQLSRKGIERSARYNWDKSATDLWDSFVRMCGDAGLKP
jgi:glycosyltransferase involved in cell wall biosynthesis